MPTLATPPVIGDVDGAYPFWRLRGVSASGYHAGYHSEIITAQSLLEDRGLRRMPRELRAPAPTGNPLCKLRELPVCGVDEAARVGMCEPITGSNPRAARGTAQHARAT